MDHARQDDLRHPADGVSERTPGAGTFAGLTRRAWRCALAVAVSLFAFPGPAPAQPLPVAFIGPLSGPAASAADARALRQGMQAHFAQVNAQGGVGGRTLVLHVFDDRYDGAEFARQFAQAMQRRPLALLSPLGLGAMRALLEGGLLDRHDVVVINAIPGATPFRVPGHARLFHVRAGDQQQIEKMLRHAQALGLDRAEVLVQDLHTGEADVREAHRRAGATLTLNLRELGQDPQSLPAAAAAVREAGARAAVLVLGSPPFMAQATGALRRAGVAQPVFTLSYVQPQQIVAAAGPEAARGVGIVQALPNPNGRTLPLHREFQAAMQRVDGAAPPHASFHLEGYLSARVLTEALRRDPGMATPAQLAESLRGMGARDLGGFWVDFSRGTAGSSFTDIAVIASDGRLLY